MAENFVWRAYCLYDKIVQAAASRDELPLLFPTSNVIRINYYCRSSSGFTFKL